MLFLGIDPGIQGAIAFWKPNNRHLSVHDIPIIGTAPDHRPDGERLARIISCRSEQTVYCILERVNLHPQQSLSSGTKFLDVVSRVRQALETSQIRYKEMRPADWRRLAGLPSLKGRRTKKPSLELARKIWPEFTKQYFSRVKDADRAEAALMALAAERLWTSRVATFGPEHPLD